MDSMLSFLVPLVEIDLRTLPGDMRRTFVEWACIHKLPVRKLLTSGLHQAPLAQQILSECDTSKLDMASVDISLTNPTLFASQRAFQDLLVRECPKLGALIVVADVGDDMRCKTDMAISPRLFSAQSIHTMGVKVVLVPDAEGVRDGNFLCSMTQNLPQLQNLMLYCDEDYLISPDEGEPVTVRIVSPTVTDIRLQDFCDRQANFSLNCPRLETCGIGGGILPPIAILTLQFIQEGSDTVPASCRVLLYISAELPPLPFPYHMLFSPNRAYLDIDDVEMP